MSEQTSDSDPIGTSVGAGQQPSRGTELFRLGAVLAGSGMVLSLVFAGADYNGPAMRLLLGKGLGPTTLLIGIPLLMVGAAMRKRAASAVSTGQATTDTPVGRAAGRSCMTGCLGCYGIAISCLIFVALVSGGQRQAPTTASTPQLIVAAAHIVYGAKIYDKSGNLFGEVAVEVHRDENGEECVRVKRWAGEYVNIKRAEIRYGREWFVDANDPALKR